MTYSADYLAEVASIAMQVHDLRLEAFAVVLAKARANHGRVFVLGVGGSAANASHLVNDLRKIAAIEAYAPTDNVAELTARTNDDGWDTVFVEWLQTSRLRPDDVVLVLSVGGGSMTTSANLMNAVDYARSAGAYTLGIVADREGFTAQHADLCLIIPMVNPKHITPHAESFQSIIGHLLVWHPIVHSNV